MFLCRKKFKIGLYSHVKEYSQYNIVNILPDEKMKRKIIFVICCFCFFAFMQDSFSQDQHKIDSLLNVLKTAKEDTNKTNILNQLASLNTYSDPEKSFGYSSSALALAEKLGSKKYIFQSYQNMSVYYFNTGNPQLSVEYIKKSIPLIEEAGDKHNLADAYGNLSNGSYYLNDYYGAFAYSKKALDISEEIKDSSRIATWLNTIGNNLQDLGRLYYCLKLSVSCLKY